jgi:hypothetical protein
MKRETSWDNSSTLANPSKRQKKIHKTNKSESVMIEQLEPNVQQQQEHLKVAYLTTIPNELHIQIFSQLKLKDYATLMLLTCKNLHQHASTGTQAQKDDGSSQATSEIILTKLLAQFFQPCIVDYFSTKYWMQQAKIEATTPENLYRAWVARDTQNLIELNTLINLGQEALYTNNHNTNPNMGNKYPFWTTFPTKQEFVNSLLSKNPKNATQITKEILHLRFTQKPKIGVKTRCHLCNAYKLICHVTPKPLQLALCMRCNDYKVEEWEAHKPNTSKIQEDWYHPKFKTTFTSKTKYHECCFGLIPNKDQIKIHYDPEQVTLPKRKDGKSGGTFPIGTPTPKLPIEMVIQTPCKSNFTALYKEVNTYQQINRIYYCPECWDRRVQREAQYALNNNKVKGMEPRPNVPNNNYQHGQVVENQQKKVHIQEYFLPKKK